MSAIKKVIYEIDPNILTLDQISCIPNYTQLEKIQEFYNYLIDTRIKFNNLGEGEKSDPKKGNTFIDYFRSDLYNKKDTRFKLNPKTNVVILSKRYYEKEGFTLSFCAKTFKILDFKHFKQKEIDVESEEIYKDIISIETLKEGTNMIVVIQNGKIVNVRTTGTYDAKSSYDTTKTHYELFFETLDKMKFGLSKIFDHSKTKPGVRFCFNFLLKLNFTPFPTFNDNEIHLISSYEINDKTDEFSLFNEELLKIPKTEYESKEKELKEYVKTKLTLSYINDYDINNVISLFNNIGSGIIKGPEYYNIISEIDIKSIIEHIITKQDALQGEKGLILKYSDGSFKEKINPKYQIIYDLRCSCSMEVSPKNKRNLFYELFMKLKFTKDNEKDRNDLFQEFLNYYDGEERLDEKGGEYVKLISEYENAIIEYANRAYQLYETNRIQAKDHFERIELDKNIPMCFKYKHTNIVNIIHSYYQKIAEQEYLSSKRRDRFYITMPIVHKEIIVDIILKSKYEGYINNEPKFKFKDIYGDIYGKIMTPK